MISIKTEFDKSNFNYDRTFDIVDILPYSDEYIIQPNELSFHDTFNTKMSYLYDNFLYLYSRCSFPNFKIPTSYTGFIGVTGSDLGIYSDTNNSDPFANAGFPTIDDAKNAVVYKKDDSYYFFINSLSAISVLRYSGNNNLCQACPRIITTVDPISGDLKFQKINSISILENKYLCVSDEYLDVVYKYDLDTFFLNENIFKSQTSPFGNTLFLLQSVGGQGNRYDSIKFEKPKKIPTYGDLMLVEDSGNKIFKLFNSNFDFLSYKTFISLYDQVSSFKSIKFKNENEIYGIVDNGYFVFDINAENYKITLNHFHSLSSILYSDEKILDIEFCKYEENIFYILTNKGFIKKWENVEGKIIGRKNAIDFGATSEFKWFTTSVKTTSSDNIYIYLYNSNAGANQILIYEDALDLISVFENVDFQVYSRDEIKVKKNEWNQAWVYEKSIKKIAKNCEILKDNIHYNIIRNEGEFGSISDIKKIYNTFSFEQNHLNYDLDYVIGVNENFQSSIINREFRKIYSYQNNTLNFINLDNDLDYYSNAYVYGKGKGIVRFITNERINKLNSREEIYPFPDTYIYVSPNGNDTNDGSAEFPFLTIHKAQEVARSMIETMDENVIVNILEGDYRLDSSITFNNNDSGINGYKVIYRSFDGIGKARLLGSKRLSGWKIHSGNIWKINVPNGTVFHTLYENGQRLYKARFPNRKIESDFPTSLGQYLSSIGGTPVDHVYSQNEKSKLIFRAEDTPPTTNVDTMKINIFGGGKRDWNRQIFGLKSINTETHTMEIDGQVGFGVGVGARFFLEDDFSFLNDKGEFFLDKNTNTLYCIPYGSGNPDNLNISYPILNRIIQIQGTSQSNTVKNIVLDGLSLEETDNNPPRQQWSTTTNDGAIIWMRNTSQVEVLNCHLKNSGRSGIMMIGHNTNNIVNGCWVEHIGLNGISLSNWITTNYSTSLVRCENNRIYNTHVSHVGELICYAECITVFNASNNEIDHCVLDNSVRYGITVRGNTGPQYQEPPQTINKQPSKDNYFHHILVANCGQDSGDMGAVHTAQVNIPNGGNVNTFEQIVIRDTKAIPSMLDYAPNGIFLDWPKMSMDQVFKNVEVIRSQGPEFRANGNDNKNSTITENVSWKTGFDSGLMDYSNIGLTSQYPTEYGGRITA